jgi:hypothetical protein
MIVYGEFNNKYFFVKNNKSITLVSLSPKQVYEDQLKLKRETKAKRSEKKEVVDKRENKEGPREKKEI